MPVPVVVLKSTSAPAGSASMNCTSVPAGICSVTVTCEPTWKVPRMRHDHVAGSPKASFASVDTSGPPSTEKLNRRPRYAGVKVSLQTFSVPTLPPAGWLVNVTIPLEVDEPTFTTTLRVARFWLTCQIDGRT